MAIELCPARELDSEAQIIWSEPVLINIASRLNMNQALALLTSCRLFKINYFDNNDMLREIFSHRIIFPLNIIDLNPASTTPVLTEAFKMLYRYAGQSPERITPGNFEKQAVNIQSCFPQGSYNEEIAKDVIRRSLLAEHGRGTFTQLADKYLNPEHIELTRETRAVLTRKFVALLTELRARRAILDGSNHFNGIVAGAWNEKTLAETTYYRALEDLHRAGIEVDEEMPVDDQIPVENDHATQFHTYVQARRELMDKHAAYTDLNSELFEITQFIKEIYKIGNAVDKTVADIGNLYSAISSC